MDAKKLIQQLELTAHQEGGHYRRTYQSEEAIPLASRPDDNPRHFSTAIYFLLQAGEFSAWHKLRSEEMWHHYEGENLHIHTLDPQTHELNTLTLGKLSNGGTPQLIVPRGLWFCAEIASDHGFTLCGCTVTPGFDFTDFELPQRDSLLELFPEHAEIIKRYTHN